MKFKSWISIQCFLVLVLFCSGTVLVWAAETSPTPTSKAQVTVTPKPVTIKPADKRMAAATSNAYKINVTGQDIADLRVNQKLGYGEIGLLYGLASASGKTVTDILAMRQSDMGWGELAKSLGLKVSAILSKNSSVLKAAKMPQEDQKIKAKVNQEDKTKKTTPKPTKAAQGNTNGNPNSTTKHSSGNGKK